MYTHGHTHACTCTHTHNITSHHITGNMDEDLVCSLNGFAQFGQCPLLVLYLGQSGLILLGQAGQLRPEALVVLEGVPSVQ